MKGDASLIVRSPAAPAADYLELPHADSPLRADRKGLPLIINAQMPENCTGILADHDRGFPRLPPGFYGSPMPRPAVAHAVGPPVRWIRRTREQPVRQRRVTAQPRRAV